MINKLERKFVSDNLKIIDFNNLEPYFERLKNTPLYSKDQIWQWLLNRSELESIISEELAWRYIKMNADTNNNELAKHFEFFVTEIEPSISLASNELDKQFIEPSVLDKVDIAKLYTLVREMKKDIEIFREENVAIEAELQQLEQQYGAISSKMTVVYNNEELTLQKAANYLKDANRENRHQIYHLIQERRLVDKQILDTLLDKLIAKRNQIAINAGFDNYVDFKFREMGRFDYGQAECNQFHQAVSKHVTPIVNEQMLKRKLKLGLDSLKPWDLDVDDNLQPPLKPFGSSSELVQRTTLCFRDLDPEFGIFINEMNKAGHFDLDSRIGKAPGGFNYPLHESNMPFIFMNSTGNLRDMITMLHEGGHAVHAFLSAAQPILAFKQTPSEIAELASMSMELLTMDHWHRFFDNPDDLKRAKLNHLNDILTVLPWVATIDKFQQKLYLNPGHSHQWRTETWQAVASEFGSSVIDYTGVEHFRNNQWQKQLHIFEVPFYYIEYGFAQLGAIAIWRNYKLNKQKAISQYKDALKLGYSTTIPLVYKTAGIEFNFSEGYIKQLTDFVKNEIEIIEKS